MKTVRVLNTTGDTAIAFDETEATAADREKATTIFNEWMAKKWPAFQTRRPSGKEDEKVTNLKDVEEGAEVILFQPITAG